MTEQKTKPIIEDVINKSLNGDMKHSALGFAAWLRTNKMSPGFAGYANAFNSASKGKTVCKIEFNFNKNGSWLVTPYLENIEKYADIILAENLQGFVWDNVIFCIHASKIDRPDDAPKIKHYGLNWPCDTWNCAPGKTVTICGKVFENKCRNSNRRFYWFKNPNEAEITAVKRLIELEKQARAAKKSKTEQTQ